MLNITIIFHYALVVYRFKAKVLAQKNAHIGGRRGASRIKCNNMGPVSWWSFQWTKFTA